MAATGALPTIRPAVLHPNCVQAVFAEGWAFDQRHEVVRASLRFGRLTVPAVAAGFERPDIASRFASGPMRSPYAATSGLMFAGVIPPVQPGRLPFQLELELASGGTASALEGAITVSQPCFAHAIAAGSADVAIAMATFNPPADLFQRQVDSIRSQRHESWICIVCDDGSSTGHLAAMRDVLGSDGRFVLIENRKRVGFYLNFERALVSVPRSVSYVALADQDDCWHSEKLVRQVAALESDPDMQLVASDVRVTDAAGSELAPTFYAHRAPTNDDPYSLFLVNSLIGASMLMRRGVLDVALPFPQAFEDRFHDHWLARTALLLGTVGFVTDPLHDYVQHGANVFGDRRATQRPLGAVLKPVLRTLAGGGSPPASWGNDFVNFPLECAVSAQLLRRRHPKPGSQPWLSRIVSLDDGQLRELSQICVDNARERRSARPRRENIELALFTGRSWAMSHRPQPVRR